MYPCTLTQTEILLQLSADERLYSHWLSVHFICIKNNYTLHITIFFHKFKISACVNVPYISET